MDERLNFIIEPSYDCCTKFGGVSALKSELEKTAQELGVHSEFRLEVKEARGNYELLFVSSSIVAYKRIFETEELPPRELPEDD